MTSRAMVPRPSLAEELRGILFAEDDGYEYPEAERHGGSASCGSDSDSAAEDALLLGGGGGGSGESWPRGKGRTVAALPLLATVALALTLLACVVVGWKALSNYSQTQRVNDFVPSRPLLSASLPSGGVVGLGELRNIPRLCSAHPKCVNANMATGNCCPNNEGMNQLCCDIHNMTQPPETPFQQRYQTIYSDGHGSEYVRVKLCGHILCTEFSECCLNQQGHGICAAERDKCCGLLACGNEAECCGNFCLVKGTPCVVPGVM